MKTRSLRLGLLSLVTAIMLFLPLVAAAQQDTPQKELSKEELAQLLAPIALYPDDLVTQILMASTYPLEIVQADRWVKSHKQSSGEQLAKELEKENWDPSVKSMVQFPDVLAKMSEKLDLTTKIGDAFLSQQDDVMDTIQDLRKKAQSAGNLETTKEQVVVQEKETIIIKPADPQVIYVPSYSPTVVYGTWPYPASPPYYYAPPPPPSYPAFTFATGVAVGMAWGYAWGHSDWHGHDVDIDYNRNTTLNTNIDRSKYQAQVQNRQGTRTNTWQHNPTHRKGVAYKNGATARKYGQSPARSAQARRDARGYGGAGTRPAAAATGRASAGRAASSRAASAPAARSAATSRRGGESAFSGGYGSGGQVRMASDRGRSSRQSSFASGGGFGGGSRGGGFGGGRGGGGFGGGGRRR